VRRVYAAIVCLTLCLPPAAAIAAPASWTVAFDPGISFGNQSPAWPSWEASVHREVGRARALGFRTGQLPWEGTTGYTEATDASTFHLASARWNGGSRLGDLSHVSVSMTFSRRDARALRSAPFVRANFGVYQQALPFVARYNKDVRDHLVFPGFGVSVGMIGTRGLVPTAAMRGELVFTDPGPSVFLTTGFGFSLQL
jgi:hypothetical protein